MSAPADAGAPGGDSAGESFGRQIRTSLAWSLTNNLFGRVFTFAAGIALARLLTPEDYGVFAVALVVMTLLMSLNDMGIAATVVRWQGSLDRVGPTATTLIFAISAGLFTVMYALTPAFTELMDSPEATGVVRLMLVGLLIDACAAVPTAAMTRSLQQGRRTAADLTGGLLGMGISIALAALGFGPWSLAWGRIASNAIVTTMVLVLAPVRYRPGFDRAAARELVHQGVPLAGSTLLSLGVVNVDYLVTGSLLGDTELGYYFLAFNLSSWPLTVVASAIRRVSLAGFARLAADRAALDDGFRRGLALTMGATIPACAALAAFAPEVIRVVYGAKWLPAAEPLRWLAILGGVRIALDLCWDLLVAVGRSRAVLWLNGVWLALLVPALAAGAEIAGIGGVAAAHLLVALLVVTPCYLVSIHRAGIQLVPIGRLLVRPLLGAVLIALAAAGVDGLVDGALARLVVGLTVGLLAYAAVAHPLRHLLKRTAAVPA